MDRLWKLTFALGAVTAVAGWLSLLKPTTILGIQSDIWLFVLALAAFALSAFAFLARFMAYTQARDSYLSIVTPFLRLRIAYKRIRSVRPTLIQQLFPVEKISWAQRSYIEPFYGKTVLVIEMRGYPISPALLRLFLPSAMFAPTTTGLVLLVADWMKLSTEIDSLRGAWLQTQGRAHSL
jgi:hypothetical protein